MKKDLTLSEVATLVDGYERTSSVYNLLYAYNRAINAGLNREVLFTVKELEKAYNTVLDVAIYKLGYGTNEYTEDIVIDAMQILLKTVELCAVTPLQRLKAGSLISVNQDTVFNILLDNLKERGAAVDFILKLINFTSEGL